MALGISEVGEEANSHATALYQPPMIYSGRNTYLIMAGLQYLAQCLVGRKFNKCMAALLARCSILLYQRSKIANLILIAHLSWIFLSLKMKEK